MKYLKYAFWLLGFTIIVSSIVINIYNSRQLSKCSDLHIAKIINIKKKRTKRPTAKLRYFIDSEEFISWRGLTCKYSIGDSVKINVACSNPKIVRFAPCPK